MNQHLIHNRAVSPSLPNKTPSVPKPMVVRATTEIEVRFCLGSNSPRLTPACTMKDYEVRMEELLERPERA